MLVVKSNAVQRIMLNSFLLPPSPPLLSLNPKQAVLVVESNAMQRMMLKSFLLPPFSP